MPINLSQFEYNLSDKQIATEPISPRDHSKLLVVDRRTSEIKHRHFYDLPELLGPNDVLVFNKTKVFPARLFAGKIEILLLHEISDQIWTAMHKGKITVGQELDFSGLLGKIVSKDGYEITIKFKAKRSEIYNFIEKNGITPIPPYIKNDMKESELRTKYQTVYAQENGSVAAPTAGLHFTNELIDKLIEKGVQIEYVTLHVGAGTFLPIKSINIRDHKMHEEYYSLDSETANNLNRAKALGKRIIAVGTTTTRVLETCTKNNKVINGQGKTNIYIYPPYKFKFIDALITNFHLPHSTLLALVSAFVSKPNTKKDFEDFKNTIVGAAYIEAINNNYRFYSFGDGMFIL